MVINDLRASMNILNEKASEDRESLKKATRAQKRRAERFEAAIEKCYAQLKEKVFDNKRFDDEFDKLFDSC